MDLKKSNKGTFTFDWFKCTDCRNYLVFDQFIPISSIVFYSYQDVDGSIRSSLFEVIRKIISIFGTLENIIEI